MNFIPEGVDLVTELEVMAADAVTKQDKAILDTATKEMRSLSAEAHRLRNYAVELEQRNAAQADRIRALDAQLKQAQERVAALEPLPHFGDSVIGHTRPTHKHPSWSQFPTYRLGGKALAPHE